MKIVLKTLCLLLLLAQGILAQEKLTPNQPVSRNLDAGKTDLFSLNLNDGELAGRQQLAV